MKKDDIGNRMKENYENRNRVYLTRRTPVILRLDGKAFHTFTKDFEKPYSLFFKKVMIETTNVLMENIQGAQIAYTQSDEISIFISDYKKLTSEAWFDYNVQKMTSVSASIATAVFNKEANLDKLAFFDSRVFNIPKEEVANYFRWRYVDWKRNSIQMLAQSLYSHKELHGKNTQNMLDMCYVKGKDWHSLDNMWKNGTFIFNTVVTENMITNELVFDGPNSNAVDWINSKVYKAEE